MCLYLIIRHWVVSCNEYVLITQFLTNNNSICMNILQMLCCFYRFNHGFIPWSSLSSGSISRNVHNIIRKTLSVFWISQKTLFSSATTCCHELFFSCGTSIFPSVKYSEAKGWRFTHTMYSTLKYTVWLPPPRGEIQSQVFFVYS